MGWIAGGLVAMGVGEATAGVATTALIGAGVGAAGSAITGGDPLKGALMGGVLSGVGAGAGAAFGGVGGAASGAAGDAASALGDGTALGGNLGGSGFAGAGLDAYSSSAAAMGYGPSAASSLGDAAGLSDAGYGSAVNIGNASGSLFNDSITNGLNAAEVAGMGYPQPTLPPTALVGSSDTAGAQTGANLGDISKQPLSTYDPLNQAAGSTAGSSASQASGVSGTSDNLAASKGAALAKGAATGGDKSILGQLGLGDISKADILKGVLSMGSNLLGGSPKQYAGAMPGPSSTAATQGPYFNQPLQPYSYTGPSRTQVAPTPTGQFNTNPGGVMPTYFANNSLANYGFGAHARGGPIRGALTLAHGGHEAPAEGRVRGPGSGISDDVPAMLSNEEYVLTARDVSTIGGGSSEEGARRLDAFRQQLHRSANKKQFLDKHTEGALDRFSNSIGGRRHG